MYSPWKQPSRSIAVAGRFMTKWSMNLPNGDGGGGGSSLARSPFICTDAEPATVTGIRASEAEVGAAAAEEAAGCSASAAAAAAATSRCRRASLAAFRAERPDFVYDRTNGLSYASCTTCLKNLPPSML